MNGGISNLGHKGGCHSDDFSNYQLREKKVAALTCADKEVRIGTPDSIGIASNLLKQCGIEIPTLQELLKLHEEVPLQRNSDFAMRANQLQQDTLRDIDALLRSL